jgi:hypothetical protein
MAHGTTSGYAFNHQRQRPAAVNYVTGSYAFRRRRTCGHATAIRLNGAVLTFREH